MSNVKKYGTICALMLLGSALSTTSLSAQETTTQSYSKHVLTFEVQTTVNEETVVKKEPIRICVIDFTSADTQGQKRFLDERSKPITIPTQSTLNDADRVSVNSVMQGYVRMIDAIDTSKTNDANRREQSIDNALSRAQKIELYNTVVKGESRPMVIGADYLTAYLGRKNDLFSCVDTSLLTSAMTQLQNEPDFPDDFMLKLAEKTGVTHLVYGTVSDIRTKTNSFKGYGIETKTTMYQLDVIVKLVDLKAQHTIYSNVYTANYKEQDTGNGGHFDNNIFQNLMTTALEMAADDLYEQCQAFGETKN